jgi:phospholipid/cholesterol/gamma-HCH transport system ATP-binding protein
LVGLIGAFPGLTMQNGEPAIAISELRKTFGGQTILNGIDLQVPRGETMVVLGRSGTGKSVLLKLIVGLQKADAGSIRIHGKEVTNLELAQLNEIRKTIGFLFQQAALYDSLTVEENVEFPMKRLANMPPAERKDRVRDLLSQVGMERDLNKLPSQISGGMQKRVGLARALALDPDILLCDEPTTGLDPITAAEIDDLILTLHRKRKITAVVVTHDLHDAKVISNRLAMLHQGNILIEGTFEELEKSQDSFVLEFLRKGV